MNSIDGDSNSLQDSPLDYDDRTAEAEMAYVKNFTSEDSQKSLDCESFSANYPPPPSNLVIKRENHMNSQENYIDIKRENHLNSQESFQSFNDEIKRQSDKRPTVIEAPPSHIIECS